MRYPTLDKHLYSEEGQAMVQSNILRCRDVHIRGLFRHIGAHCHVP